MLNEEAVLEYFYKQNRQLTLTELFEKFCPNDRSILVSIHILVDKGSLEEYENNPLCWIITDEGKKEYELREKLSWLTLIILGLITLYGLIFKKLLH